MEDVPMAVKPQKELKTGTVVLDPVRIDLITVVIRFGNESRMKELLDAGVPYRPREDDASRDRAFAQAAREEGRPQDGEVGNIRKDRVDTAITEDGQSGEVIVQQFAQIACVRSGLANNGWGVVDYYVQSREHWVPEQGYPVHYGLYLLYKHPTTLKPGEQFVKLPEKLQELVRGFSSRRRFNWLNVFVNMWQKGGPIPPNITINVSGGQVGQTPKCALVIKDHVLQVIPVTAPVEEAQE
jgi:hypothetical protein